MISDDAVMADGDTITRTTGMGFSDANMVPKRFLSFWKGMKVFSLLLVIAGLVLQFSFISKTI